MSLFVVEDVSSTDMLSFGNPQVYDGLLLFSYFLFQLADLIDNLVEFLFGLKKFSTDFS